MQLEDVRTVKKVSEISVTCLSISREMRTKRPEHCHWGSKGGSWMDEEVDERGHLRGPVRPGTRVQCLDISRESSEPRVPQVRPGVGGRMSILGFCFPGCVSIQGPKLVRGQERSSVTVECLYKPGWETNSKWWCRGTHWAFCKVLLQTTGSQQTVQRDRVSITDNQNDRVITIIMTDLRRDDQDTYWCGINKVGTDLGAPIRVTIDPGESSSCRPRGPGAQDRKSAGSCLLLPRAEGKRRSP